MCENILIFIKSRKIVIIVIAVIAFIIFLLLLKDEWRIKSKEQSGTPDATSHPYFSEFISIASEQVQINERHKTVKALIKASGEDHAEKAFAVLSSIKSLYLIEEDLSDLSPIGNFSNINYLHLSNSSITDIRLDKNLNNIRSLWLKAENLSSLEFLERMPNLENLMIIETPLRNLEFVTQINKLKSLYLTKNNVNDCSALREVKTLVYLSVYDNPISSLAFIEHLDKLQYLSIGKVPANDFEPLQNLPNIKKISINNTSLKEIKFVKSMTLLHALNLAHNEILDISGIEDLPSLINIDLSNNHIKNIYPLSRMLANRYSHKNSDSIIKPVSGIDIPITIILSNNGITDISSLGEVPLQLDTLNLKGNTINDFSPLARINVRHLILEAAPQLYGLGNGANIELLDLSNSAEVDFAALNNLSQLKSLSLDNCNIHYVPSLSYLSNLSILSLNSNSINVIPELSLPELVRLSVAENKIRDFHNFSALLNNTSLSVIVLDGNHISSIKPIARIAKEVERDCSISLLRNPIADYEFANSIRESGWSILTDQEQEQIEKSIKERLESNPEAFFDSLP